VLANLQEAVSLYVEDLIEAGESIPVGLEKGVLEWNASIGSCECMTEVPRAITARRLIKALHQDGFDLKRTRGTQNLRHPDSRRVAVRQEFRPSVPGTDNMGELKHWHVTDSSLKPPGSKVFDQSLRR
jgi:predicted RNA binding protein YcfA (HicA-like mRNA interferase family)